MTDRNLLQAMGSIDPKLIADAAPDVSQKGNTNRILLKNDMAPKSGRSKKWVRGLAAAVLVLVLIGGGSGLFYHNQVNAVASVISLDVNPSMELRVNRNKTVLSCAAMNEDAAVILYDMGGGADLVGTKLDVAVNAIVGSLLRHGYFDSISSAILISVEDSDPDRASCIREELVAVVDDILQGASGQSAVYSQNITIDQDLEAQAQNSNISSGKAYLVNQVIALNGSLDFDALAALSVEELRDLIKIGAPGMPIGMDAAALAAEEYAGTLGRRSNALQDVDPELDEQPPHYEVELYLPGRGEFEYKIDAFTGAVLSGQKDIVGTSQPSVPDSSSSTDAPESQTPSGEGNGAADISADTAKAAALSHAGLSESQVSRLKVERDWDDGRLEYEVEFVCSNTKYDYTIDGLTGEVRSCETEPVPGKQTQKPSGGSSDTSDIGADAAKAAALSHAGLSESQVTHLKVERDWDDGRLEYEVEFKFNGYEYEYTISGTTGAILEHEADWDD